MKMESLNTAMLIVLSGVLPLAGINAIASAQSCPDWDVSTGIENPGLAFSNPDLDGAFVDAFTIFDDGSGPALYAGGKFTFAGGSPIGANIAKWDGTQWQNVFLGTDPSGSVTTMLTHNDGAGEALYVAGSFSIVGGIIQTNGVAKWDGSQWSSVGPPNGLVSAVTAMAFHDDGTGSALYVFGSFDFGTGTRRGVIKWDGSTWSGVGLPFFPNVFSLVSFDDGSGAKLYAGGAFSPANGFVQAKGLAVFNGTSWENVGGVPVNGTVNDIEIWNDGTGPGLYIGGTSFFSVGSLPAIKVAKWDGTQWSSLGGGLGNGVFDLEVWDDGAGEALYATGNVVGELSSDGSSFVQDIPTIARWDGNSWGQAVPPLTGFSFNFSDGIPLALRGFNDGTNNMLYVGGDFRHISTMNSNGNAVTTVAKSIASIRGCDPATTCSADLTGDGLLNFFDVSAFLAAFSNGDPVADFTGDGQFNFFDVSAFLAAFSAGCP